MRAVWRNCTDLPREPSRTSAVEVLLKSDMNADANQSATDEQTDVSEVKQFDGSVTSSFWRHSPRRRQGRHPSCQEPDKLAHNGYPRRAAETFDGDVTFTSDEIERPQRGNVGTNEGASNESEGETDIDWDANSLEYGIEQGCNIKGGPNATVSEFTDRKRKLHRGERVSIPDGKGGYQNFGDTENDKITLLERADRKLQSSGIHGRVKQLILESLRLENESGLKRWNAHHGGKSGALVGWTAYYTTEKRARQLADSLGVTIDVRLLERHAEKFIDS